MSASPLTWTKHPDGSYHAASGGHTYTVILEPRPVDRYLAYADGEVQRAVDGPEAGQKLLFWYLREAKGYCESLVSGGLGFAENTEKQGSDICVPSRLSMPYPTKDQVIAAVRAVTGSDGRVWPVVDRAWEALAVHEPSPSAHTLATLETYVLEIAKWGRIRRWLTESDMPSAAFALWDVREQAIGLRGRDYSETGVAEVVLNLYVGLMERMRVRGVAKAHYSWASKILHWLLPSCAPVYDSLVLQELQVGVTGPQAYREIINWEYNCAQTLQPSADEVLDGIREMTLLAAIDNCLWWSAKSRL